MSAINNEVLRDPVVMISGTTQPSLADTITFNGETVDMSQPGTTVVYFMRPLLSRTPIVNSATATPLVPPDEDGHNVRYDWQSADTVIEGPYMGWWGYTLPGSALIESPEFPIIITDHGPGFSAQTGAVVDGVSQWLPTTLDHLRQAPTFGDRFLQKHADLVKRTVMGVVVTPDQEINYDPLLVEYLSKATALRLITPAKDYWSRQPRTLQTQGPSEMAAYPDMIAALEALHLRLRHELVSDWRQLQFLVPGLPQLHVEPTPISSLGDPSQIWNRPVTPDPQIAQPARTGGPFWDVFPFFG